MTRHPGAITSETPRHGFQPAARRRNRIAAGVALGALAIGGNVLVYSSLNRSQPVVQVTTDVPAGAQITSDMLGTVEVDAPGSVNVVPAENMAQLVGQYAKVRMVAGSLATSQSFQPRSLVAPGHAVVAIEVNDGALPVGLRERVPVVLVVAQGSAGGTEPLVFEGEVVALPSKPDNAVGTRSLSVELTAADAAVVAASDDVRVVLAEQG
jgi:hypothetical protein